MPYDEAVDEPVLERWMVRFGEAVRAARSAARLSQQRLEDASGVDQTTISRLEHGRTPHMTLVRIARISVGLGGRLPIGTCPHEHGCPWTRPLLTDAERALFANQRHLLASGSVSRAELELLERLGP